MHPYGPTNPVSMILDVSVGTRTRYTCLIDLQVLRPTDFYEIQSSHRHTTGLNGHPREPPVAPHAIAAYLLKARGRLQNPQSFPAGPDTILAARDAANLPRETPGTPLRCQDWPADGYHETDLPSVVFNILFGARICSISDCVGQDTTNHLSQKHVSGVWSSILPSLQLNRRHSIPIAMPENDHTY